MTSSKEVGIWEDNFAKYWLGGEDFSGFYSVVFPAASEEIEKV